jgi:hypothetical protein
LIDEGSSEFELSLDPDSSSEFELSLNSDSSSEEISLGDMPVQRAGNSGINISKPSDSGVSLERKKGDSKKNLINTESSEEIDFVVETKGGSSAKNLGKNIIEDSDSEFELTLDEDPGLDGDSGSSEVQEGGNDIFETDFEIPALEDDSGSEVLPMDEADTDLESSDFDLAVDSEEMSTDSDESGSNIEIVDDEIAEDEDAPPKTSKKKKKPVVVSDEDSGGVSFDDMDLDSSVSASKALRGIKSDDDDEIERVEDDDDDDAPRGAVVPAPAPWGALPAIVLLPTSLIAFVAVIMAYEVFTSLFGYRTNSNMVVEGVTNLLGMK